MSRSGPAQPTRAGRLLDVERFERVAAPGATTLLRLIGRLHPSARVDPAALVLVVGDGGATHRFAALDGPWAAPTDGRLTAAFAVPQDVVDAPRAVYGLQLGRDGRIAPLAAPVDPPPPP